MKGVNNILGLLFFNRYNDRKGLSVISLLIAFVLLVSFASADTGYEGQDLHTSHYYKTSGSHIAGDVLTSLHFIEESLGIENEENDNENDYGICLRSFRNKKTPFFNSHFPKQLNSFYSHTEYYILYCCLKIHLLVS
ncbi:hypothetical protein OOZ15_05255 [Galbibacter sp. EGI 63066]|uniref:hypothetical protein n=1 Tax=Galbibacter sp. EGI 63066 TaxID=2993559 RepID=UPI002249033F|nr:hypothetical protein [Galbibacter sp. EGI 63066]MCX2679343.1 hypothetical protein [Galbibacter sp. EGI 63066]